jgi:hypothetical protein
MKKIWGGRKKGRKRKLKRRTMVSICQKLPGYSKGSVHFASGYTVRLCSLKYTFLEHKVSIILPIRQLKLHY